MRHLLLDGCRYVLVVLLAAACTIPPAPGSSATLPAEALPADARALAYGRTAGDVIRSPELSDKIPALFGADWAPASEGRGQVASGAASFFEKGGPLRMVHIAGADYIALTGCVAAACNTRRVLLLIREGGEQLLARLDEGAFSRYYAYGGGGITAATAPATVDAGLRALRDVGDPYPSAGP